MTPKLLILAAVVMFLLAAFGVNFVHVSLLPLGLAFYCAHKLL